MPNYEDVYDVSEIDKEIENRDHALEDDNEEVVEFTEKDYLEWYNEQKKIANKELTEFEQHKSRTFDDIVQKFKILIGLKGGSYNDATKMIFYSVLANQLKFNNFTMESKKIDLRLPILLQLKAGHGKKNYEYFIRRTIEGVGRQYQEPTSYHPEQFVGKIIVHEDKDDTIYIPVFGTLAADFLVIDEAFALLTRKENEECLRYLRTALDPIGDNKIEKKQVNVPDNEKLTYMPCCTVVLLSQPITYVNENLLRLGSFRRFVVLFVDTTLQERLQARRAAKFLSIKEDVHNKMWEKWISLNKDLLEYKNLKYVCPDFSRIDDYLDDIGTNAYETSLEVLEYYNTSQFTIKQNIFKMAIIRATLEHTNGDTVTIQKRHINEAIRDWHAIWIPQVQWIASQMIINSDRPLRWTKLHTWIANILTFKDCNSQSIVKSYLAENPREDTKLARQKLYRAINELRNWGYIKKEGTGKRGSYTLRLIKRVVY